MIIYDVIKKPHVTEKTTAEKDAKNVVVFVVNKAANKIEIKESVEKLFKVDVSTVKTVNVAGKVKRAGKTMGKRPNWKKAYVSLRKGCNIDFFEV